MEQKVSLDGTVPYMCSKKDRHKENLWQLRNLVGYRWPMHVNMAHIFRYHLVSLIQTWMLKEYWLHSFGTSTRQWLKRKKSFSWKLFVDPVPSLPNTIKFRSRYPKSIRVNRHADAVKDWDNSRTGHNLCTWNCQNHVKIMSKSCQNHVAIMSQSYHGNITIMLQLCHCVKTMSNVCPNSVKIK